MWWKIDDHFLSDKLLRVALKRRCDARDKQTTRDDSKVDLPAGQLKELLAEWRSHEVAHATKMASARQQKQVTPLK
jgi:hypothetical protein